MQQPKCGLNCLECKRPKCIHDIQDERKAIREMFTSRQKEIDRVRHAEYYKKNKEKILAKQNEYNNNNYDPEKKHAYYLDNKEDINKKSKKRYEENREVRLRQAKQYYEKHRAEISERRKNRRREQKIEQREVL